MAICVIKTILDISSVYSCHLFLISSVSVMSLPFLSFIVPIFAWNVPLLSPIFLKRSLVFPFLLFPLCLYIVHLRRLFFFFFNLSLLFFGTLHSDAYIFPFRLCFSLLFFSQLSVRPPQTTILPSCISFSLECVGHWLLRNVVNLCPEFFTHSIRSNPLNLFITSTA